MPLGFISDYQSWFSPFSMCKFCANKIIPALKLFVGKYKSVDNRAEGK
jgi:hypothetical protein